MKKAELLKRYRATILDIEELEHQLEKATPSGAPSGCRSMTSGERIPSTNAPMAAALQLAAGLENIIRQKREQLSAMNPQVYQVMASITSGRILQVIQCYYLLAQTDEQIAHALGLSTTRVNQIRNKFMQDPDF